MKKFKSRASLGAVMAMVILGGTLCSGGALAAEAAEATPSFNLDQMVVTATRTEKSVFDTQANITVISREDLEKKHYTDLGEALKDVPGVNLQNYGASGDNYTSNRLYINGSSNIVVLVDGMRANVNGSVSSVFSPSELANLDVIERIEVLKGSASTLYGSDAVGGVINIITRKASGNNVNTSVGLTFGSYGKQTYKLTNRGSHDGLYWMASAQKNKVGDFKDGHGNKVIQDVDADNYTFQIGKKFKNNDELTFNYQKYQSNYQRPKSGGLKETNINFGKKSNDKLSLQYTAHINEKVTNKAYIFRNRNILKDNYEDLKNIWLMDLATIGFSDQITWQNKDNTLIGGFDYYQDRVNDYSSTSYGNTDAYSDIRLTNRAFFLQDEWNFAKGWNITPGIRYDNHSEYGSHTSKSVTLGYKDADKTNYYASYKEFFVAPNQYQIYSKYGGKGLNPSEGRTLEFGINHNFDDNFSGTFNVYKTKADNIIAFDSTERKYKNITNEETTGWSLGLIKTFDKHFSANVGYTHTSIPATSDKENTNRNGYIPTGQWNMGVDYEVGKFASNLNIRGIMHRPGRKVNAAIVPNSLKTFWLFDVTFNYNATKNIKTFFKVNNLFDKFYTDQLYSMDSDGSWYSAPGRNFLVGVEYNF